MHDDAPELRPPARRAIVERANAYWHETGASKVMRDCLFDSWAVTSLKDLKSQFGLHIGGPAFKALLSTGVAAAPNQFTAAVVSCAIAHLPSNLLEEALKGTREEIIVDLDKLSLEETLGSHALRTGYPFELARGLAAGAGQTAFRGRATSAAQERFLAAIPQETRELVFAARIAAKAKRDSRPNKGAAAFYLQARQAAMQVLGSGDDRRSSIPSRDYVWLKTHDVEWLNANFPRRHSDVDESLRTARRNTALTLKSTGAQTRKRLEAACSQTFAWLAEHDAKWLRWEFPGKILDVEVRRKKWRSAALAVPFSGASPTRAELRRSGYVYWWLRRYDEQWLDRVFPVVRAGATPKARRP